jgi:hypothetical protein
MRFEHGGSVLAGSEPRHEAAFRWHWKGDDGKFNPYTECISGAMETACARFREGTGDEVHETVHITRFKDDVPQRYKIDFGKMEQIHPVTGYKRDVARKDMGYVEHPGIVWEVDLGGALGWRRYEKVVAEGLEEAFRAYAQGGSAKKEGVTIPGRPEK